MSIYACWWWWLLTGLLLGWLASWWFTHGAFRKMQAALAAERRRQATLAASAAAMPVAAAAAPVVEKIVERLVDNPAHLERVRILEARLADLEAASVPLDREAALAAGFKVRGMDDLEIIEGIGPKIATLLTESGTRYFFELARLSPDDIRAILDKAGPNFALARPDTWPEQAVLAAANRWAELRQLQDALNAGNR